MSSHLHAHARTRAHTHTHTHTHRLTRTAVQGAPIRRIRPPQSILICTCCAHRTESPNPAYFGWRQEMRARDSRRRAASAGLFAPTGEPASRGSLRVMHMGCLRSGGCSASDLESRRQWRVRAVPICTSCDLIEVTAPHGVRLQPVAVIRVHAASLLTRGLRDARGRPR